jgi:hypothetical protein
MLNIQFWEMITFILKIAKPIYTPFVGFGKPTIDESF